MLRRRDYVLRVQIRYSFLPVGLQASHNGREGTEQRKINNSPREHCHITAPGATSLAVFGSSDPSPCRTCLAALCRL